MDALKSIFVIIAMAAVCFFAAAGKIDGEKAGGEVFFNDGTSSSTQRISETDYKKEYGVNGVIIDYFPIKAESVFVSGQCNVAEVLKEYRAKPVKIITTGSVTDYYCFSTRMGRGVNLYGKTVNFHLAVTDYGYTVGTPIICGGY